MAEIQKRKQQVGPKHGPMSSMGSGEKAENLGGTLKKLGKYLGKYKVMMTFVVITAMASTIFNIISPNLLGNATDVIVEGLMSQTGIDFGKFGQIILILVAMYGTSFIFSIIQGFIMAKVSQDITYTMRRQISEKIDRLPLRYFDSKNNGDLQSRVVNDIETINQSLSQSLTQMITSIITIIGIIVMMVRISFIMTIAAMLVLPLSVVVIRFIVSKSQKHFQKQQSSLAAVNGHVEEMFKGQNIVKAFNKETESQATFDTINEELYESAWKSQYFAGAMMPIVAFIGNLGYVVVCILGGYLAINGRVTIGNIQAFIQYVRNFNQPISQVANIVNLLQSTAAAAERVFDFLEEDEEADAFDADNLVENSKLTEDARLGIRGNVCFNHVSFGYKENEPVIKDFSFSAKAGDTIAIVGPTGAGKTTLVKLLLRYYEVNAGNIEIDGKDITEYTRQDLRDLFGMVLQDTWLFNGTIFDNIRYGKEDATREEVIAAAKAANVHHHIETLPEGYDLVLNEESSNISQGQKQLLTIARAMLADSPITILDEATSSVDTRTERHIQTAMDKLMKNRTSFVIAHRLSTIKDADTILVIDQGNIVEQGTHDELLAKKGFYEKLYNSQFEE